MEKITNDIPVMFNSREMIFDKKTLEAFKYLELKGENKPSDICEKSLVTYLDKKFKEHNLEHFIDPVYEERLIAIKLKSEEEAKKRDEFRLLEVAKARILQAEVQKIRDEEAKIRAEEARTGMKVTKFEMVKVEVLKYVNYEGNQYPPGSKIDVDKETGLRWDKHNIARIIQ